MADITFVAVLLFNIAFGFWLGWDARGRREARQRSAPRPAVGAQPQDRTEEQG